MRIQLPKGKTMKKDKPSKDYVRGVAKGVKMYPKFLNEISKRFPQYSRKTHAEAIPILTKFMVDNYDHMDHLFEDDKKGDKLYLKIVKDLKK